jgi:hypothetical protein
MSLLHPTSAGWGALTALVLLLGFAGAMVIALARGRQPECGCFGGMSTDPVGAKALLRNLTLAGLAVFVLVGSWLEPGLSIFAPLDDLSGPELMAVFTATAALVIAVASSVLVLHLLSQQARLLARIDELASSGGTAPEHPLDVPLMTVDGTTATLPAVIDRPTLFLFWHMECRPCQALLPTVRQWHSGEEHHSKLVAVVTGDVPLSGLDFGRGVPIVLDPDFRLARAVGADGAPACAVLGPGGDRIGSVAVGVPAVSLILEQGDAMDGSPRPRELNLSYG